MTENYSERFASREAVHEYEELYASGKQSYANILYQIECEVLDTVIPAVPNYKFKGDYLDFATGTGRVITHLERRFCVSDGIDISSEMLAVCARHVQSSNLMCLDITADSFTKRYDVITSFRFFLNAGPFLAGNVADALLKHLRDDGLLIVNNHGRPFSMNILGAINRLLGGQSKQAVIGDGAFEEMFEQRGMVVSQKICYGVLGGRLAKILGFERSRHLERRYKGRWIARIFGTCAIYVFQKRSSGTQ